MNQVVTVVGIPGVGKDHVLAHVGNIWKGEQFHFGDELKKIVDSQRSLRIDRDSINDLPKNFIHECIDKTIKKLLSQTPTSLNYHMVRHTPDGYTCNFDYERRIHPLAYVHIVAPPEMIHQRRLKDNLAGIRNRPIPNVEIIREHQKRSISATNKIALDLGVPSYFVSNIGVGVEEEIKNYLINYLGEIK